MTEPTEIPDDECRALLHGGVVGRVALCTADGPMVVPVNYTVVAETIVFRTSPYGVLARARDSLVAFEIDELDHEHQRGWSVVATGRARAVEDGPELAEIQAGWDPHPWAGGQRPLYLRLEWTGLSGRRTGSAWDRDDAQE